MYGTELRYNENLGILNRLIKKKKHKNIKNKTISLVFVPLPARGMQKVQLTDSTVKTRNQEPTFLGVSLNRFLYKW